MATGALLPGEAAQANRRCRIVICFTALGDVPDRIPRASTLGATDYVVKPFSPKGNGGTHSARVLRASTKEQVGGDPNTPGDPRSCDLRNRHQQTPGLYPQRRSASGLNRMRISLLESCSSDRSAKPFSQRRAILKRASGLYPEASM